MSYLVDTKARRTQVADCVKEGDHFLSFVPLGEIGEESETCRPVMIPAREEAHAVVMMPYTQIEEVRSLDDGTFVELLRMRRHARMASGARRPECGADMAKAVAAGIG